MELAVMPLVRVEINRAVAVAIAQDHRGLALLDQIEGAELLP